MLTPGGPTSLVPERYQRHACELLTRACAADATGRGAILEIGCFQGGLLWHLAHLAGDRRAYGVDTFAGHPYCDPGIDHPQHHVGRFAADVEQVRAVFAGYPQVTICKGRCEDVLPRLPEDLTVAFAYLDVDQYRGAVAAIEYLYPRLTPRGILIIDEYQHYFQKAWIDNYFLERPVDLVERKCGVHPRDFGLIVFNRR